MTLKEALEITINTLSNINVPIAYMNQIGAPIAAAVANLTACVEGLNNAEKNMAPGTVPEEPEAQ